MAPPGQANNRGIRAKKGIVMEAFDYIVVGGGTAGCVLATRLSQDPGQRVLLLEAGAAVTSAAMANPAAWPALWRRRRRSRVAARKGAGRVQRDQRHDALPRRPVQL